MLRNVIAASIFIGCRLLAAGQSGENDTPEKLLPAIRNGKPDTLMVSLLLRLGRYYVLKHGEVASDLDSSELLANKAKALSEELYYKRGVGGSYLILGMTYNEQGHKAASREALNTSIKIFQTTHYKQDLGDAYQQLAWKYSYQNEELTTRLRLTELALASYREAGAAVAEANTLKELADLHQTQGKNEYLRLSLQELKAAMAIYDQTHDSMISIWGIYDLLGTVSRQLGNYTDALKYGLLSLKLQGATDSTASGPWLTTICNRLGSTYTAIRDYKEALRYYQMALTSALREKDTVAIREVSCSVALSLFRQSKYQEALDFYEPYFKAYPPISVEEQLISINTLMNILIPLKQLNRARPYYLQALRLGAGVDRTSYYASYVQRVATIYLLGTGQYSAMLPNLRKGDTLFKEILKTPNFVSFNELAWFKADSALGDYRSAIVHLNKHIFIEDSLFNEVRRQERDQLQVQYETEKKDKDIQLKEKNILLLTEQSQLEHSRLMQSQSTSRLILGGAIAMLLLLGLGYNRYRLKQRSNRQLEAQKVEINKKNDVLQELLTEKEWFIKEIHHRVKNNLQIITSLLNIQSAHLDSDSARLVLKESQQRMHAMSLIHQKLYQSDSVDFISMPDYIRELVSYLKESFDLDDKIEFRLHIECIDFDVAQAVPVGLILNEAITNSIKHAFPKTRQGIITVTLSRISNDKILLAIGDSGVGLPANYIASEGKCLGMSLMRILTRQLDGSFESINDQGLTLVTCFASPVTLLGKLSGVNTK